MIETVCAQSQWMERNGTLAAEWFSLGEMMVLQGVSVLIYPHERVAVQGDTEPWRGRSDSPAL